MKLANPASTVQIPGWQIIGKLKLPLGSDAHSVINAWLSEVLTPLYLQVGFVDRVLKSAEDAAVRAMQTETVMKYQHSHLLIYIPANHPVDVHTWGFFRIEKIEPTGENTNSRDHSIEFYLYLERQ